MKSSKLRLNRETVRELDRSRLNVARGGVLTNGICYTIGVQASCVPTCTCTPVIYTQGGGCNG